ncbi:MAG: Uma2 family endonuclease [Planctomycetes bacterium]|nr:Uma2 family endonuclease [Planctomycetota bacterium]
MSTVQVAPEQRLSLSAIPWASYVLYSDGLGQRHVRITYDRGEMEIMTLSPKHEGNKKLLARLVETLTEEMNIDIASYGSMTCRREDLLRGLEADEAYWIENEPLVRGRDDLDLDTVPPPDLTLEVEISRSALDRMSIYAALRVPEVWRWDGETLRVFLLTKRGTYRESNRSKAFPFLPLHELVKFLKRADQSETQILRAFRAWVRKHARDWKKG